jgi:hypothetical protein
LTPLVGGRAETSAFGKDRTGGSVERIRSAALGNRTMSHSPGLIHGELGGYGPLLFAAKRISGIVCRAEQARQVASGGYRRRRRCAVVAARQRCLLVRRLRLVRRRLILKPAVSDRPEYCQGKHRQHHEWDQARSIRLNRRARVGSVTPVQHQRKPQKQTPGSAGDPGVVRDDCSSAPLNIGLRRLSGPEHRPRGGAFGTG